MQGKYSTSHKGPYFQMQEFPYRVRMLFFTNLEISTVMLCSLPWKLPVMVTVLRNNNLDVNTLGVSKPELPITTLNLLGPAGVSTHHQVCKCCFAVSLMTEKRLSNINNSSTTAEELTCQPHEPSRAAQQRLSVLMQSIFSVSRTEGTCTDVIIYSFSTHTQL